MRHNVKNRYIDESFIARIADYIVEVKVTKSGKVKIYGNKKLPAPLIKAAKLWYSNNTKFADLTLTEYLFSVFTEPEVYEME